jgi:hypothetical protein
MVYIKQLLQPADIGNKMERSSISSPISAGFELLIMDGKNFRNM